MNTMIPGLLFCVLLWGIMMYYYVFRPSRRDRIMDRRNKYKEELDKFFGNMEKLGMDKDEIEEECRKIPTFRQLKKKNRELGRAVKKYKWE